MTSTNRAATARRVALELIDVGENVRELDQAHVDALAASIALQGILVPLVVQAAGEGDGAPGYDLVAGFHRYAAASQLRLHEVPVVLRGEHDDHGIGVAADRATENILSCRRRHDVINADRVVMPRSESKCPAIRCGAVGEVGIRTGTDPGSQIAQTTRPKWGLPLDSESEHATDSPSHARVSGHETAL
jgi:hypothetical protein